MIAVDKGIPLAPDGRGRGRGRLSKYPWADMEVGDSFLARSTDCAKMQQRLSNNVSYQTRCYSRRYVTRIVEGGVRVWRVE